MAPRFEVRLTLAAQEDLANLYIYIAEHRTVDQANRLIDELLARIATVETFPLQGLIPRELAALGDRDYRQLSMPPFRLSYEVFDATVLVSLIVDGRRDLPELLVRRLLAC